MWISKGQLDLHHGEIEDYIFSLAERRLENQTLNRKVCEAFNYMLHNNIRVPISGWYLNSELIINPGKTRLFASWFKHFDSVPIVLCHIPKYPQHILKNQISLEFENLGHLLNEVDVVNIDQDNKLTIVDKSWSEMSKTFDAKKEYNKCWHDTIASKWGSVEWQLLGNPILRIDTDKNEHETIVNTSHALGLYESICHLSGLENSRTLGFQNIIYSTVKRA